MAANTVSVSLDAMIMWLGTYKPEAPELHCHVAHSSRKLGLWRRMCQSAHAVPRNHRTCGSRSADPMTMKALPTAATCDFDGRH
jgi:hypothetical protein